MFFGRKCVCEFFAGCESRPEKRLFWNTVFFSEEKISEIYRLNICQQKRALSACNSDFWRRIKTGHAILGGHSALFVIERIET